MANGVDLNLESFFDGTRMQDYFAQKRKAALASFESGRAVSRGQVASRLAELDRLRAPSREIILSQTGKQEDIALQSLLSSLQGEEFGTMRDMSSLSLQK